MYYPSIILNTKSKSNRIYLYENLNDALRKLEMQIENSWIFGYISFEEHIEYFNDIASHMITGFKIENDVLYKS